MGILQTRVKSWQRIISGTDKIHLANALVQRKNISSLLSSESRKPLKTVQQKPAGIRHKNTAVVCKEKFDREQEHTDS